MNDMIVVKDLTYRYDRKNAKDLFQKLSFTLKKGSFTTLVGPIGSGKSTLVQILLGVLRIGNYVKIDDLVLCPNNIKSIRSKIGVVFENSDDSFVAETVMDEIAFSLENMNLSKKEIWNRVKEVSSYVGIDDLLEVEPHSLSSGEKQLVSLASAIAIEPKIIILDEALTMIDRLEKEKIFKILKELNEKKDVTILNITHDLDESLYGNDILLLQDGKVVLHGSKEEVLKEEQLLKNAGLELPFLVDLSIRLMYYGVLDHMILDMNEMVNTIWK